VCLLFPCLWALQIFHRPVEVQTASFTLLWNTTYSTLIYLTLLFMSVAFRIKQCFPFPSYSIYALSVFSFGRLRDGLVERALGAIKESSGRQSGQDPATLIQCLARYDVKGYFMCVW
jgi:hypothetical protein